MRIDTKNRQQLANLITTREQWQGFAWGYRDAIPEVRYGTQFVGRNVAKVKILPGVINPEDDQPTAIPGAELKDLHGISAKLAAAAEEELSRLPIDSGPTFHGPLAENFEVAGECWLHGYVHRDPDELEDPDAGEERWEILSVDEVVTDSGGYAIKTHGRAVPRPVRDDEELIRLWVRHPRYRNLADSPLRAMLDTCEDLVLIGREIRAAARSRIASNGFLKVPTGLMLSTGTTAGDKNNNPFTRELTEAMIAPISNEGDPGAAMPVVITGEVEDLAGFDHLRVDREDSPQLLEKIDKALGRLANGMDLPPEVLMGMAEANHWTAWQIDASTYRNHLEPMVNLVCEALCEGYLRPALRERGFSAEEARRIVVMADSGSLTENPNRGQDAKDLFDRGGLKWEALAEALGFSPDQIPDDAELLKIMLVRTGMDTATVANLLNLRQVTGEAQKPLLESSAKKPVVEGEVPPGTERQGTPGAQSAAKAAPKSPVVAALLAASTRLDEPYRVDTDTGRELAGIQAELRVKILTALDASLERALERAGAKLRTQAQRTAENRARYATQLSDLSATDFLHRTSAEERLALGLNELEIITEALTRIKPKIMDWTRKAIAASWKAVARITGETRGVHTEQLDVAWERMQDGLQQHAVRYLQQDHPNREQPGEVGEHIVPAGVVREFWHNTTVPQAIEQAVHDAGAVDLGFQWRYGPTPRENSYEPHLALNGRKFTGFDDPALHTPPSEAWVGTRFQPGEHAGCFIADTEVSGPRPVSGFERPYTGKGIEIRTDAGQQLTGTPNHPILTPRGWIPLGELQEGDDLVVASGDQRTLPVYDKYQQVPARIQDVARTLPMAERVIAGPMPTSAEDFHGDGVDGEVAVVAVDSGLLTDLQAAGAQLASDDVLKFACPPGTFPAKGVPSELVGANGASAGSGVSVSQPGTSLIQGGALVTEQLSCGESAPGDAEGVQAVQDGLAVDPVPSSESLRCFAGQVTTAKVIRIDRVALTGHVYNLSTLTGWYVANGIIASNCLCDYMPVWAIPEADVQNEERMRETPAQRARRELAEQDVAAGRVTDATRRQDQRRAIERLQASWINGE